MHNEMMEFLSNSACPVYGRIPLEFRTRDIDDSYIGVWVAFAIMEHVPFTGIQSTISFTAQQNRGVIVDFSFKGVYKYATIRYFDNDNVARELSVPWCLIRRMNKMDDTLWLLRHKYTRIRRHIHSWLEHIRYKPGSAGFLEAKSSFYDNA